MTARLSGKNWYTEPIATRARSASRVVVRPLVPHLVHQRGAGVEHPLDAGDAAALDRARRNPTESGTGGDVVDIDHFQP